MEKGTDKIIINGGDFFEGTRDLFRHYFLDNATNENIIYWCEREGVYVSIYCFSDDNY